MHFHGWWSFVLSILTINWAFFLISLETSQVWVPPTLSSQVISDLSWVVRFVTACSITEHQPFPPLTEDKYYRTLQKEMPWMLNSSLGGSLWIKVQAEPSRLVHLIWLTTWIYMDNGVTLSLEKKKRKKSLNSKSIGNLILHCPVITTEAGPQGYLWLRSKVLHLIRRTWSFLHSYVNRHSANA